MANRTSLPFSRGLNIQWWELSGRSAEVSIMFSPRVLKFPPIRTLYSNKYDSKGETDFSVQLILHKRTLLEVFVKIIWILDFHPSYTYGPHGDVAQMSPKSVGTLVKIQNLGHFYKSPLETVVYAIYIERWDSFCICYVIYLSVGYGWGTMGTLGEKII